MAFTLTSFRCLMFLLFVVEGVLSIHVINGDMRGLILRGEGETNPYLTIIQGLLRSDKIVNYASEIPCNIIQTLESDAGQAQQFVEQIEDGQVPTIIQNLPTEVIAAFSSVLGIFVTLPSQLVGAAEAAVTDAANIFNDIESGAIVSDIEKIPSIAVSDITSAWGDLTSGLEDDWNAATNAIVCFFDSCTVTSSTADSCGSSTAVITSDQVASQASVQSEAQASETGQPSFQASLAAQSSFFATVAPAAPLSQISPIASPTGGLSNRSSFTGLSNPNAISEAAGRSGVLSSIGRIGVIYLCSVGVSALFGLTLWL